MATRTRDQGAGKGRAGAVMGRTHVYSGLAAGAATLPFAPVEGSVAQTAWIAVVGGAAMLPDLDHPRATVTRMWGPITAAFGRLLRILGRGHRGGTHDLIVAPVVFGALAAAAAMHPISAGVMIAFAVGLAVRGAEFVIPGRIAETVVINLAISICAGWLAVNHAVSVGWLPYAIGLGVAVHIIGDAVTRISVPIPFTWLVGKADREPGLLTTGRWYETMVIGPAFLLACAVLMYVHVPGVTSAVDAGLVLLRPT